jgi:hypothetical protein
MVVNCFDIEAMSNTESARRKVVWVLDLPVNCSAQGVQMIRP